MQQRPKWADDVIYREIDDEIVVIKEGRKIHVLNKTAARIWEMCDGEFVPDQIATRLCERYDVSAEKANADVRKTLASMMEMGLLRTA